MLAADSRLRASGRHVYIPRLDKRRDASVQQFVNAGGMCECVVER
jgi:hypothetical protein